MTKNLVFILLTILPASCSSVTKKDLNGLKEGVIIYNSTGGDCRYIIGVTNSENRVTLFDPVNLESDFKKNNLKVAFQYQPLKMPNRCDRANPIRIKSIIKL